MQVKLQEGPQVSEKDMIPAVAEDGGADPGDHPAPLHKAEHVAEIVPVTRSALTARSEIAR